MTDTLFDLGLQPERAKLARRRTALTLAAAPTITLCLLPALLGNVAWMVPRLFGLAAAALLWACARRQYLAVTGTRLDPRASVLHGAGLLLAATAAPSSVARWGYWLWSW